MKRNRKEKDGGGNVELIMAARGRWQRLRQGNSHRGAMVSYREKKISYTHAAGNCLTI